MLQSMGSQRVDHDLATEQQFCFHHHLLGCVNSVFSQRSPAGSSCPWPVPTAPGEASCSLTSCSVQVQTRDRLSFPGPWVSLVGPPLCFNLRVQPQTHSAVTGQRAPPPPPAAGCRRLPPPLAPVGHLCPQEVRGPARGLPSA